MISPVLSALTLAMVSASHGVLRHAGSLEGFVKSLEFHHRLRVCNAYPFDGALELYRGKTKLTGDSPMTYKTCRDFVEPLKSGDKLEFKVGDASAGTFSVSDLPNNDAVLLLIINRHDSLSTAVSFESHVFSNMENPQIAVIDTYKGKTQAHARILDGKSTNRSHSEELRYDSVVAVSPGIYEVEISGQDGETKARQQLVALSHESYVVLRTGLEAKAGASFPQDLIIFPASDAGKLRNHAGSLRAPLMTITSLFMMLFLSP